MTLKQLLGVVEIRTKVVSLSTLATATLYAWRETGGLDAATLALTAPAVLLVDMGTTAFNSFFDYWRGVDDRARATETDKVLVTEGVPPLAALIVALSCYFLAACLGLALAVREGAWVIAAGSACLAVGFLYNGGPLPISGTPLGELAAGGTLGAALFLVAYGLQAGSWGARPLLASLPGSLFIASILTVNNTCDIEGDRAAGRRTLSSLIGARAGGLLSAALGAAAFGATARLSLSGILPAACAPAAAGAAVAAAPVYARMLSRGFSHGTKSRNMRSILLAFVLWSIGLAVGLAAALAAGAAPLPSGS
jgi:1,4-dihydroxy-2-naphthoate octaprenyltransferase